jgi:hypothetical protein
MIAIDVSDAGGILRQCRVNLSDRAAIEMALFGKSIEAALFEKPPLDDVQRRIESGGRLDGFIERAVECAKAHV